MEPTNNFNNQGERPGTPVPQKNPASWMAAFSLIFGITGALFCLSPLIQLPLGIAAIAFAFLSRQQGIRNVQTSVGMVTGIMAVILSLIIFFSIIYVYRVVLNDPVMGPIYNDMYEQVMGYWGQMAPK